MKKQEIITLLYSKHQSFVDYINALPEEHFLFGLSQKWTAGQQLDHILLSVKPLVLALFLPKFMLKLVFGKSNRIGKNYEELVKKYLEKLQKGGLASSRFKPKKSILFQEKGKIIQELIKKISNLATQINSFSEEELDTLILPHPLLGKLTLREMLYFTIYHVEHHHKLCIKNLENRR